MQDRLEKLFDLVPDDEAEKEAETEKIPIANEEKLVVEKIPIANEEKLVVDKIPIANEEKLAVAEEDLPKGILACLDIKHSLFHPFSVPPPRPHFLTKFPPKKKFGRQPFFRLGLLGRFLRRDGSPSFLEGLMHASCLNHEVHWWRTCNVTRKNVYPIF